MDISWRKMKIQYVQGHAHMLLYSLVLIKNELYVFPPFNGHFKHKWPFLFCCTVFNHATSFQSFLIKNQINFKPTLISTWFMICHSFQFWLVESFHSIITIIAVINWLYRSILLVWIYTFFHRLSINICLCFAMFMCSALILH